ncbi:hypothetical protein [Archangium primigenium]|nr:hypothetical protein [Archangium primigenium]
MNRRSLLLASMTLMLLPRAASAAPKSVVLLFSGDNGGEIAPCG